MSYSIETLSEEQRILHAWVHRQLMTETTAHSPIIVERDTKRVLGPVFKELHALRGAMRTAEKRIEELEHELSKATRNPTGA